LPAEPPALAVVIVTYNSAREIARCLASIVPPAVPPSAEIVVVDNASTDGTPELIRAQFPAVQVVASEENLGFARASNLGAARTTAPVLLLLNPDTVVDPEAIPQLAAELSAHPEAAAAGPRLIDERGRAELSFGPPISPWGELRQKALLAMYNRGVRPAVRHVERLSRSAGERSWVSGACLLIRRTDWDAVGGFDERFFMYTEDVDLCRTLIGRGRTIRFVPAAEIRHLRGRSAARNPDTERLRRMSQIAYYDKHLPHWVGLLRWYLRITGRGAHG
jgi:GT2 family glycosyltransferase